MSPAEIVQEFRRKYESTYVFVQMPESEENNLFFLSSITPKGNSGVMMLESEEFGKIQLNLGTAHTIKFMFPKVGVFQSGPDAYLFLREPRRQWQRGLCQGNCSVTNVAARLDSGASIRSAEHLDFTLVAGAFAGITYSYKDAVRMLAGGKHRSVAIGDGFSLLLSPIKTCQYLLMFWTSPVAGISAKGEVNHVLEASFDSQIKKITQ